MTASGTLERRARPGTPRRPVPARPGAVAPSPSGRKRQPVRPPRREAFVLAGIVAALCGFGLVMVLSSSSVSSIASFGSPWSEFERQAAWTAVGAVGFLVASRIGLKWWRRAAVPLLVVTAALLAAVLVRGVGTVAGGSSRWIGVGPLRLQPSELAKLAVVLFVADLLARRRGDAAEVVRPVVVVLVAFAILIVRQPDLGTAAVVVAVAGVVLFAGGVAVRKVAVVGALFCVLGGAFLLIEPYGRARLDGFLHPFAHASSTGYQLVQSLATLGSGHVLGTGLGGSEATWGFLPNANTDFVFAVIGNNFGLVGAIGVLAAFVALGWVGIRISARSEDRFASLVAIGVTTWIVVQAIINIGGVIGLLPETGIPLPFLSAGGSSLVVLLVAVGILVHIARHPAERTASHAERTASRADSRAERNRDGRPARAGR